VDHFHLNVEKTHKGHQGTEKVCMIIHNYVKKKPRVRRSFWKVQKGEKFSVLTYEKGSGLERKGCIPRSRLELFGKKGKIERGKRGLILAVWGKTLEGRRKREDKRQNLGQFLNTVRRERKVSQKGGN